MYKKTEESKSSLHLWGKNSGIILLTNLYVIFRENIGDFSPGSKIFIIYGENLRGIFPLVRNFHHI
jgi:hypothetical protein